MLILLNLKSLIKKMPLFFIIIMFILFFTITGTIYIFNYNLASNMKSEFYNEKYRTYIIENTGNDLEDHLDEVLKNFDKQIQRIYLVFDNDGDKITANYSGSSRKEYKVQMGRYFDNDTDKDILVPYDNLEYSVGDIYHIGNEGYTVIGINSDDTYEIQFNSLDTVRDITSIAIITETTLNVNLQEKFLESIKKILAIDDILIPEHAPPSEISADMLIVVGIIMLGTLNISFVFLCIMERRKKQQSILYILGCKLQKLFFVYISEFFVLITASFVVCSLIARYILFPVLSSVDQFFYHAMTISQYLFLYVIYTIPILIILICQLIRFLRKTPYELNRR